MDFEKELNKIEDKVEEVSFAMEILQDYKKQNKRLFIIVIILCIMLASIAGYTIWLLNDISVVETSETYSQDVSDIGDMNNSNIVNGGNINDKD